MCGFLVCFNLSKEVSMNITTFQMDAGDGNVYAPHPFLHTYAEKKSLTVSSFVLFERSSVTALSSIYENIERM